MLCFKFKTVFLNFINVVGNVKTTIVLFSFYQHANVLLSVLVFRCYRKVILCKLYGVFFEIFVKVRQLEMRKTFFLFHPKHPVEQQCIIMYISNNF